MTLVTTGKVAIRLAANRGGKQSMNDTLSSRREFLQTTVRGAVALPLLASLGMATMTTEALAERAVAVESSLCLFEAEVALGANMAADLRRLGLAYQAITLDDAANWHALQDTLATSGSHSLAVLGRPATVFAVRNLLEPSWRVVLEGRHRHVDDGMQHAFHGLDAPMNSLAGWVGRVVDPAQYAVVLASLRHGELPADAARQTLNLQSTAWPGNDLVSLLAWPKGAA
jgi:hypothetical protein